MSWYFQFRRDVHGLADISDNGFKNSFGVMVNFQYDMEKVEARHAQFAQSGEVSASKSIAQLAAAKIQPRLLRASGDQSE